MPEHISITDAAKRKGVSRQAASAAALAGTITRKDVAGHAVIVVDKKFEAWLSRVGHGWRAKDRE